MIATTLVSDSNCLKALQTNFGIVVIHVAVKEGQNCFLCRIAEEL